MSAVLIKCELANQRTLKSPLKIKISRKCTEMKVSEINNIIVKRPLILLRIETRLKRADTLAALIQGSSENSLNSPPEQQLTAVKRSAAPSPRRLSR